MVLAAGLMMLLPVAGSAAVRVFVGGPYWGPYWGPAYPYGYGYYAAPNSGQIKLDTPVKTAEVFINGAYAGTTKENKTMHLRPGSYNIEIREAGRTQFTRNVYVAPGKTMHLHPEL
jgi:hypothetical protein